jgi:hypothetical protein
MDTNGNVCFSENITKNYYVSSSDVCALAPAPHLCSGSQDCGFSSAIASGEKEDVKSYGCSAGGVLSRFIILVSMLIVYGWLRKKRKKKKGGI